ncbi:MAG: 16S rRNA (adenine(1518)-N(6)/adenine(1519)-N(6))-dimethyltransferase RsmA [Polaromonas sp.]
MHIPRKRFGQHFLVDPGVIEDIVRQIAPRAGQRMVEIGPGLGALTQPLVERLGQLTVIELDRDLAARLRVQTNLAVLEADVLKVDFAALGAAPPPVAGASKKPGPGGKLRVVGNLPYNISTPILFHLLPFAAAIQDQHFMLQQEVVDRMVAAPATSAYGRLSVMLQWRYAMEAVLLIGPQAFDPPPRVQSAVVRMAPREDPAAVDPERLRDIVRVAFSQRRKLLRHTLGRWLDEHAFAGKFDTQRRAEEVPVDEYLALAAANEKGPLVTAGL